MSYTPRTDHEEASDNGDTKPLLNSMRQLERELNAAQAEDAELREVIREAHESLAGCREDTCELIAERDWWKNEPRCGYSARWAEMQARLAKAESTLSKLQTYLK